MRAIPRALYLAAFAGLAFVAAASFNGIVQPSMMGVLTTAVLIAIGCALPGLVWRKLWPLTIVLLPIFCYLFIRWLMPVPDTVEGFGGQYHYYVDQLYRGAIAYRGAAFPQMPLWEAPELRLLLGFCVYWLIGVAAFCSISVRSPLPGIVLILILLGFSMTVDASPRAIWPAFLFLVLSACLFVLSRGLDRTGWHLRDAIAGGAVGAVGAGLALVLLLAAPSTASAAWYDWHTWGVSGTSVYTFNWLQNYPKLLDPSNNTPVMKVSSPLPCYWRANALDDFTGTAWVTSQAFMWRLTAQVANDQYVYSIPAADPAPKGKSVVEQYSLQKSISTNYLFIGGDPTSLTVDGEISPRMNEMRSVRVSAPLASNVHYSVKAVIPQLKPQDLVGLGSKYPSDMDTYLTLPFSRLNQLEGSDKQAAWIASLSDNTPDGQEWINLYELDQRIVGDATDPYQIVLRVEQYLRSFYSYTLTPPRSDYNSPYAAFLFDTHAGYCQHFAGAMALLLRYNGIPARVAVGFATGEETAPNTYLVTTNNAHAWVEAYFPTVGWVAFDPTPGRNIPTAGPSSTSPGFINPFTDNSGTGGTTQVTLPPRNPYEGPTTTLGTGGAPQKSWLSRATWLPWVLAIIVVIAGWPLLRGLWRRRNLHRGSNERRLQASLGLLRRDLRDYGAPVHPAQTFEEILQAMQIHIGLEPDASLVSRADAILFGGRQARPQDVEHAETLRRAVNVRLRRRHGWLRTAFAVYGVPRLERS